MPKIAPFLWLDNCVEEAVAFYTSVFRNAKVKNVSKQSATFELEGQTFLAFNGGPMFKFNEAVSFFIGCETQDEIDYYWQKLIEGGGSESRCGWLKDRFGLSWQVVPTSLGRYIGDPDPAKAKRALEAMLSMNKLDIAALERAHAGT
jgi:predicted 3-demethylubiquinone-9 3-methyltransferase (glyoxalase superfamily)